MADLLTNMNLEAGRARCHDSMDLVLTPDGDLALTEEGGQDLKQRIILWLGTPKGERFNKEVGCPLHAFVHERNTIPNLKNLEAQLYYDLNKFFPEFKVISIKCSQIDGDPYRINIMIKNSDDQIQFLFSPSEMIEISNKMANVFFGPGGD